MITCSNGRVVKFKVASNASCARRMGTRAASTNLVDIGIVLVRSLPTAFHNLVGQHPVARTVFPGQA